MKAYTIAELEAARSFDEIEGDTQTGATNAIKYKRVDLARSETYSEAVVVSRNGGPLQIIEEPALRRQFLHSGV